MAEIDLQVKDRLERLMFREMSPCGLAVNAMRNDWEFEAKTRLDSPTDLNIRTEMKREWVFQDSLS